MTIEATKLFTRTFFAVNEGFMSILNFREVGRLGLRSGMPLIWEREVAGATLFLENPENDHLFIDKGKALAALGGISGFAARNTKNKTDAFQTSIDGASLVFAHSLLDSSALDYCKVIALIDPREFLPKIGAQSVAVRDVMARHSDDILTTTVKAFLEKLEKESLIRKIDVLNSICKPEPRSSALRDYAFDPTRLKELDSLRNNMVHKYGPTRLPNGDADITYLLDTSNHLMGLINQRFDLRMDPAYIGTRPEPERLSTESN